MLKITEGDPGYTAVGTAEAGGGTLSAWKSRQDMDALWDRYLAGTPGGHFYQTSMWAEARKLDGWQPLIVAVTLEGSVVGGFQILTRSKSYVGKIGLVLKGPVVSSHDDQVIRFVIKAMKETARSYRMKALIVQPPDRDGKILDFLVEPDFSPSRLENAVKNNTVLIDLSADEETLFKAVKKKKRQNIKTAARSGITVREGGRGDLGTFFRFMLETCRRQQIPPSPSSEEHLIRMWDAFSPTGNNKLFISEYSGEIVSCLMVIPFGDTAHLWKFGWSGRHPKLFPNETLYWEILRWAKTIGYRYADLGAVSKDLAGMIWNNEDIAGDRTKTYSYYKLSFGGEVARLTEGFVYFSNPLLRRAYNFFMPFVIATPWLKNKFLS